MHECKVCPFQFSLPRSECEECEFSFKKRKKIEVKIWIKRIRRKNKLGRKYKYKTIIELKGPGKKWKERALRRLRKEFHCNGFLRDQLVLNGNFIASSIPEIVEI